MAEYDNTNTFALFVNDKKTDEKHPDRTGTLNVDGVEYYIDGWIRKTKDGRQFLSGRIKQKHPAQKQQTQPAPQQYSDDAPF